MAPKGKFIALDVRVRKQKKNVDKLTMLNLKKKKLKQILKVLLLMKYPLKGVGCVCGTRGVGGGSISPNGKTMKYFTSAQHVHEGDRYPPALPAERLVT